MSHTITQSIYRTTTYRITTPTGLYEANYRRLLRLKSELADLQANECAYLSSSNLVMTVLEQHKYTTVISLQQSLKTHTLISQSLPLSAIDMDLRICHDACLVEVIGYQGMSPVQSALVYPNKHMLQVDEKKQLNLLLKDILEQAIKSERHSHSLYNTL